MRTRRKLLNSALILGLTLGNLNGTVVQAVTAFNALGPIQSRQARTTRETKTSDSEEKKENEKAGDKKEEEEKKKNDSSERKVMTDSEKKEYEQMIQRMLNPRNAIAVPDNIPFLRTQEAGWFADFLIREITNGIHDKVVNLENMNVGDTIVVRNISRMFYPSINHLIPEFHTNPSVFTNGSPLRFNSDAVPQRIFFILSNSRSGNWQMRMAPTPLAAQSGNNGELDVIFTRLKVAPLQTEIFDVERFPFSYNELRWGGHTQNTEAIAPTFTFNFFARESAESMIGPMTMRAKDSHFVLQHLQNVNPEMFVTTNNTRGNISYEWVRRINTQQLGKQNVELRMSDETGRPPVNVSFEVDVQPIIVAKNKNVTFRQNDRNPTVQELFDTPFGGTLTWVNNISTENIGNFVWNARVRMPDGRETTESVNVSIQQDEGLQIELHPIEEQRLGTTNIQFTANSFRDLIKDITFRDMPVERNSLQLIMGDSVLPNFSIAGEQEFRLTIEGRRPDVNATTRGTVEGTVNVRWEDTILMKSATGQSAGAFSLLLSNSNSNNIPLRISSGLATDMDAPVGVQTSPFSRYYSIEISRNNNVIYSQDVLNRSTLQQVINQFGNTENIFNVQFGDVIRIHHPGRTANSSVLMMAEQEHDFTYGTEYAYYEVTSSGFKPVPVMEAEASQKSFVLGENTSTIDPGSLLDNVTINGRRIDSSQYTVESLIDFDTSTIGTRKMRLRINMKDGLASNEIEVEYDVKWGDTFVLRGLNEATVGAFSLHKENGQFALHASQGVSGTNLANPVNNHFGRDTYYSIEVMGGSSTNYTYEVAGNSTIRDAINGFNNGQPLPVEKGNVIKVYHADPRGPSQGRNLLMQDELVRDYTIGSNYAYYEITDNGLEPIISVAADSSPQEFTLGDSTAGINGANLIDHITVNGIELAPNLYRVTQLEEFDTSTAGKKDLRIQFETTDGLVSKEITVPYEVKWGNTIVMRSANGGAAGAFSLRPGSNNSVRQLTMFPGIDSPLNEQLSPNSSLYYSMEIIRGDRTVYSQEMPGRATLQQVLDNFGTNRAVTVQFGDVIKIYHPQRSEGSSVLMVNEEEQDFTHNSSYAYYEVTAYGFEPMAVMDAYTANKELVLAQDTTNFELEELLDRVTINGESVAEDTYTIERLSDFDTSTVGEREVRLRMEMKDGLASVELEIPYEVKWGSTFLLKGLENATVGAFSIVEQDGVSKIHATQGEQGTILNNAVNNVFGRDTYYRIEILADPEQPESHLFPNNVKYSYEVTGHMTIRQAIQGFNNGQPLEVNEGDIFKVYHAETENRNLLMRDNLVRNFTAGSNYAHYRIQNGEFEPITMIHAEKQNQSLVLGEDASELDATKLINEVRFNGHQLSSSLYNVEQIDEFDTQTAGHKSVTVRVSTADGVTATDIEVPYEVKWGSTIHLKNRQNETVGSFGLVKSGRQIEIQSIQGSDRTILNNRVTQVDDNNVYYGIEIIGQDGRAKYQYDVRGTQTIQQAISRFNSGNAFPVVEGDVVKVYHQDANNNILMHEEQERNFTYGGQFAVYNVTEYGFEPTGELDVRTREAAIAIGTERVDPKSLIDTVRVNGREISNNSFTVQLQEDSQIDTSQLGSNNVVALDVQVDQAHGGFTTSTEGRYSVVEQGQEDTPGTGDENSGENPGENSGENELNEEGALGEDMGNLPQTNATRNTLLSVLGTMLLALVGGIFFWKKRSIEEVEEESKK
ncbi:MULTISPECIES: putative mucin/carbohydrate-binding domain-containing protein [unclassified Enterococcus]|uniref:putative mucin/carbohydrate-binding domain-containing protein n=1 Tax=unclassified Enterococcus TaxID=2608891 RepID=UPI001A9AB039|nr:putative mucin/carbohydrate-binding domain-containing protein [Enterococcus sp. DIV1271a]MBO1300505.1 LPXTG cell wall anchor domain-containing protein [Enterococcus sp. DIV1271a]